jgi:hypothetical protein
MGTILQLLNLTDHYERKARLLPALIVALPLAIAAKPSGAMTADWNSALGFGALMEGVVGVKFGGFSVTLEAKIHALAPATTEIGPDWWSA